MTKESSLTDEAGVVGDTCSRRLPNLASKTIVIVGMPGAGKSTIGRKLAQKLGLNFFDSDAEIEKSASMTVAEIFAQHGEPAFRDVERKVIARLLLGEPCVLSTGGGAFMDESTRAHIRARGVSIWLKADLSILAERTGRNDHRPLLKNQDRLATLAELYNRRAPVFSTADLALESDERPPEETVQRVISALCAYYGS